MHKGNANVPFVNGFLYIMGADGGVLLGFCLDANWAHIGGEAIVCAH